MELEVITGLFTVTWAQMGLLYYKVGKIEGHLNEKNKEVKKDE